MCVDFFITTKSYINNRQTYNLNCEIKNIDRLFSTGDTRRAFPNCGRAISSCYRPTLPKLVGILYKFCSSSEFSIFQLPKGASRRSHEAPSQKLANLLEGAPKSSSSKGTRLEKFRGRKNSSFVSLNGEEVLTVRET